jgi:alpha-beta hydrolase superfamily lysophospholipase
MRWLKRLFYLSVILFLLLNVVVYNHAYNFTHFVEKDIPKIKATYADDLGTWQDKLRLAIWGVETPKSKNKVDPTDKFEAFTISKNPQLHTWWIPTKKRKPKGVYILFHGYSGNKSGVLTQSKILRKLGYHTFLVDMRAHGQSEGLATTIGYHEAEDVKAAYDYIKVYYPKLPVGLYGTSMGAVAILKAQHDYQMDLSSMIIECPFQSMYTAVTTRFENMELPVVGLPEMLLFWGGLQNKMDAFEHDATIYAQKVTTPTLHIYGKKDARVRLAETSAIFDRLAGKKKICIIPEAGHEYIADYFKKEWTAAVWDFLEKNH